MIYYTRRDKNGRQLVTSYPNMAMAKRIKGMEKNSSDQKFWEGDMFIDLSTGDYGPGTSGSSLRSLIKGGGTRSEGGRFGVFSVLDGKPNDLGLRFKEYGAANTFMKAIADAYGTLYLIELEKVGSTIDDYADDEDVIVTDSPPF